VKYQNLLTKTFCSKTLTAVVITLLTVEPNQAESWRVTRHDKLVLRKDVSYVIIIFQQTTTHFVPPL